MRSEVASWLESAKVLTHPATDGDQGVKELHEEDENRLLVRAQADCERRPAYSPIRSRARIRTQNGQIVAKLLGKSRESGDLAVFPRAEDLTDGVRRAGEG